MALIPQTQSAPVPETTSVSAAASSDPHPALTRALAEAQAARDTAEKSHASVSAALETVEAALAAARKELAALKVDNGTLTKVGDAMAAQIPPIVRRDWERARGRAK
jgi:ribosomal protein S12 methylthiotransferase accessory factor YcaO